VLRLLIPQGDWETANIAVIMVRSSTQAEKVILGREGAGREQGIIPYFDYEYS
jgi:hypothetical protein